MDMWYFARICAHARSWREFAKCRFAHFPSFFSVHVDTYGVLVVTVDVNMFGDLDIDHLVLLTVGRLVVIMTYSAW